MRDPIELFVDKMPPKTQGHVKRNFEASLLPLFEGQKSSRRYHFDILEISAIEPLFKLKSRRRFNTNSPSHTPFSPTTIATTTPNPSAVKKNILSSSSCCPSFSFPLFSLCCKMEPPEPFPTSSSHSSSCSCSSSSSASSSYSNLPPPSPTSQSSLDSELSSGVEEDGLIPDLASMMLNCPLTPELNSFVRSLTLPPRILQLRVAGPRRPRMEVKPRGSGKKSGKKSKKMKVSNDSNYNLHFLVLLEQKKQEEKAQAQAAARAAAARAAATSPASRTLTPLSWVSHTDCSSPSRPPTISTNTPSSLSTTTYTPRERAHTATSQQAQHFTFSPVSPFSPAPSFFPAASQDASSSEHKQFRGWGQAQRWNVGPNQRQQKKNFLMRSQSTEQLLSYPSASSSLSSSKHSFLPPLPSFPSLPPTSFTLVPSASLSPSEFP